MTAGIIWIKSATRHRMAARWRRMRGDDPGVVLVPQIRSTPTVRDRGHRYDERSRSDSGEGEQEKRRDQAKRKDAELKSCPPGQPSPDQIDNGEHSVLNRHESGGDGRNGHE
jgi:hypothetical protein